MNMELGPNFSPKAQFFVKQAKKLALSLNDTSVKESHLLLLILQSGDSFLSTFLEKNDIDIFEYMDFVSTFSSLENKKPLENETDIDYSEGFKNCLKESVSFSNRFKDQYIGLQHIYFALINNSKGDTFNFVKSIGRQPESFVKDYIDCFKMHDLAFQLNLQNLSKNSAPNTNGPVAMPQAPPEGKSLESFCVNLTELSLSGKLSDVIGRDSEVERICQILARKNKNNPILIGDPGVGKTACVEGLAKLMTSNSCPSFLSGKEVYTVDLASMIAGTKYRGQFEQRLKNLIDESSNPNIILFLDEAHTVIGAGSAEGAMDAANILKPALARGEIKLIAATTYPEFKKTIEKDSALCRRFEKVIVDEPSKDSCLSILSGIKKDYEKFHNVSYDKSCLSHIVEGASIYLPNQFFPDKAIDILDEVGAVRKLKNDLVPDDVIKLEDKLYDAINSGDKETENSLLDAYEKVRHTWEKSKDKKITAFNINEILSKKSKLPIENIFPDSSFDAAQLNSSMLNSIIGQDDAVRAVVQSISRSRLGLKDSNKPIGSFLFLGCTGTGKTHCAKVLAQQYFGSEKNLIRLDMSEFSEKVSASKLIGASPGYVGYEEGGLLIEKLKKNPHSIILFDEIEKAHSEVQQLLLQILEEGELQDNFGGKAYFHNTVIILTSNIGAHLFEKTSLGFNNESALEKEDKIKKEAIKILSPELFNRIDDSVVFNTFCKKDLIKIFNIKIRNLKLKLKSKKILIRISPDVEDFLSKSALDSKMGARSLDRMIKQYIENPICDSYSLLKGSPNFVFEFFLDNEEVKYKMA